MSNVEDNIVQFDTARAQAINGLDTPAEDVVRATQLAQVNGQEPATILGDLEATDAATRRMMTTELVRNNRQLQDYINAHPLNAVISNDDWSQMDEVSQRASLESGHYQLPLYRRFAHAIAKGIESGIGKTAEGAGYLAGVEGTQGATKRIAERGTEATKEAVGEFGSRELDFWASQTVGGNIGTMTGTMATAALGLAAGGVGGAAIQMGLIGGATLEEEARNYGASPETAAWAFTAGFAVNALLGAVQLEGALGVTQALGKGLGGWSLSKAIDVAKGAAIFTSVNEATEWANRMVAKTLYDPSAEYTPDENRIMASLFMGGFLRGSFGRVKPYIDEGKDIPYGVDPGIDSMIEKGYKFEKEAFEETYKAVQGSLTRERNPDVMAEFLRQHTDAKIGVSGEAVARLYGGKLPSPDDGILGWVPDLADQLIVSAQTGADVLIPAADWHAKADPEVSKALMDDIRFRPGSVSKREMEIRLAMPEGDFESAGAVRKREGETKPEQTDEEFRKGLEEKIEKTREEEAIEAVRQASGLEPKFARGDSRRLRLNKVDTFKYTAEGEGEHTVNTFDIYDDQGRNVGIFDITEQDGGKTLYVENIAADWRAGKNPFGLSLIRSLLEQVRAEFPNAERLTGVRVSGARAKAGAVEEKGKVSIKLDNPEGWDKVEAMFREALEGGEWEQISPTIKGYVKPTESLTVEQAQIEAAVNEALDRIVPNKVGVRSAQRLERQIPEGQKGQSTEPLGAYVAFEDAWPVIAWTYEDAGALGTVRHEAIHHLRQYNFFTPQEWSTLRKAALSEKWLEKYDINNRYKGLTIEAKIEEAIADGYKKWWLEGEAAPKEVLPLFERIKDFLETIKAKITEIFGREPTWEELFQKIEGGEIGSREGGAPRTKGAFNQQAEPDEASSAARVPRPFERSFGPETQRNYERYLRLIQKRADEDYEKVLKRAAETERKRQSPDWKAKEVEVRGEVVRDLPFKPPIAADEFFRNGDLYGNKVERPKLGRDFLNEEQLAALPRDYVSVDGASPDDFAGLFGFPSGDVLVYNLAMLAKERKDSGLNPIAFKRRLVDAEVERVMEQRYGSFEEQVLEAAKEQALSQTQFQMLHEETVLLAEMAGQQFPIDQTQLRAMADAGFNKARAVDQSSDRYLADAGKAARAMEDALLKGDFQEALRQKQRQYLAATYARRAMELETAKEKFDKRAKRYEPREAPKGVDQEYANYIQALLKQAGYRQKLSPDEIAASIEFAGTGPLRQFVEHNRTILGWDPTVADWIMDRGSKPFDEMTVQEFYDLRDAIDSLHHIGREVNQIEVAGQKQAMEDFRADVLEHLRRRPERSRKAQGPRAQGKWYYRLDASLTRMEEMLKDIDFREEFGPMFKAIMVPMAQSKAKAYDLVTDLAKHFKEVRGNFDKAWRKSLDDTIPQDFIYDSYEGRPLEMTRQHLLNVMLNWGTRSNIDKLVRGYATLELRARNVIGPQDVAPKEYTAFFERKLKALIDQHARPEDWQWVQEMWKPFKGWKPEIDTVSRNITGVAPKWVEESPVQTRFGEIDGGYWPVRYDPLGSGINVIKEKHAADSLLEPSYRSITTAQSHLKARTGYVDMVDLHTSVEQALGVMQQTIHDIAYRDAIVQTARIFRDPQIRAGIRKYYGVEYEKQLMPWLRRVANQVQDGNGLEFWEKGLQWMRINLVAHTLPLNLKVVLSPDVGVPNPKQWSAFMANYTENAKLVMEKSDEIRHMVYNMDRDFREILERGLKGSGYQAFQAEAVRWGFWPTMKLSQQFRQFTFWDQYNKALAKGRTEFEAAKIADSYVRERHGAASVVDLPSIMSKNEFVKTMTLFYGYFNTMYNWQRQIKGDVQQRRWSDAAVATLGAVVVGGVFNAAVFQDWKKGESWWKFWSRAMVAQPLGTIPLLREASSFALEGHSPRSQFESILQSMGSLYSDLARKADGKPMKNPVKNTANVVGLATGLPLAQVGRTGEFLKDVSTGEQRPQSFYQWYRGIVSGESKEKR